MTIFSNFESLKNKQVLLIESLTEIFNSPDKEICPGIVINHKLEFIDFCKIIQLLNIIINS